MAHSFVECENFSGVFVQFLAILCVDGKLLVTTRDTFRKTNTFQSQKLKYKFNEL